MHVTTQHLLQRDTPTLHGWPTASHLHPWTMLVNFQMTPLLGSPQPSGPRNCCWCGKDCSLSTEQNGRQGEACACQRHPQGAGFWVSEKKSSLLGQACDLLKRDHKKQGKGGRAQAKCPRSPFHQEGKKCWWEQNMTLGSDGGDFEVPP
jgi:hypothetical protein